MYVQSYVAALKFLQHGRSNVSAITYTRSPVLDCNLLR